MRERLKVEEIMSLDLLLVPKGVVVPTEAGSVQQAATLIEVINICQAAGDDIPIIHIEDKKVIDIINRNSELFPLAVAVLDDVPGGDYDVVFNNYSHLLPSITIGELLGAAHDESAEANQVAQQRMAGKGAVAGSARVEERSARIEEKTRVRVSSAAPIPVSISGKARPGVSQGPTSLEDDSDLGEVEEQR